MKLYKRLLASLLVGMIMIPNNLVALAAETISENNIETISGNTLEEYKNDEVEITEETVEKIIMSVPDLNIQLDELYDTIAKNLNIDKIYIKELHLIAGGEAIYADKKPNIYVDTTIDSLKAPMEIEGAQTVYQQAQFIECADNKVERPSKYYLPDALYSVSYDVVALMNQRYHYNREGMQVYFDSLQDDAKEVITFCEAVLLYTGESEETVNRFYQAYEKMLYDKQSNENVVEQQLNGSITIKHKFRDILADIGLKKNYSLNNLGIILQFDKNLAVNDNIESIKDEYIVPYKLNYTSRENMMIAAMCLIGKVRYVWGGGHSGASNIDGINPVWIQWEDLYPNKQYSEITNEQGETTQVSNEGYNRCIKPSGSWCPIHGYSSAEYHGETIHSLDEYIGLRADTFNTEELLDTKYRDMLSKVKYENGINVHTLDGLDCSGFASWLYNQITDKYEINYTAMNFTNQYGIQQVEFGSELLPGDIFTWTTHIVIIVGKVKEGSKAYITVEETPNVLKFGVIYYEGASQSDINEAQKIASEANKLIGGLDTEDEKPHVYCMNNMGTYTVSTTVETVETNYDTETVWFPMFEDPNNPDYDPYDYVPETYDYRDIILQEDGYTAIYYIPVDSEVSKEEVKTTEQWMAVGRFKDRFIDEDTPLSDTNTPLKDMCAVDIIQYTLTKLPMSYVSGYNEYKGEIFNKNFVSSSLGVTIQTGLEDNEGAKETQEQEQDN